VEHNALGAVEFLLEVPGLVSALPLVDVVLGAEALQSLREFVDVFDEHAEMMDAAIVETLAELIGLEFEDRHVEGAVTQEHTVRKHPVWPSDLLEVERLLVKIGHLLRVFPSDRDGAPLGLPTLFPCLMGSPTTTDALPKPGD